MIGGRRNFGRLAGWRICCRNNHVTRFNYHAFAPFSATDFGRMEMMSYLRSKLGERLVFMLAVCLLLGATAAAAQHEQPPAPGAQQTPQSSSPATDDSQPGDALTLFPHSETSRYWISGQANFIFQWHPSFPAPYTGTNSLRPTAENATSKLYTLYLGYELTHTTEVFLDLESAEGHGISNALGVAGFTNLDVVRNPSLSYSPYVARVMIRQVIPLSSDTVKADRGQFGLATTLPARRIEIRFGKFSLADFLDLNTWGTDSHLQFLNWTVDNNGAYDYAANTRGYTDA